jgi:hypothetical protein
MVKETVVRGAWAIAGGVLTRSLPEALIGPTNNTGIFGYVANIVTAVVGGGIVGRVFGKDAGSMFGVGGAVMLVGRLMEDLMGKTYVSFPDISASLPIPQLLSGDRAFSFGRRRLAGDFVPLHTAVPYSSLPRALPAMAGLGNDVWRPAWN